MRSIDPALAAAQAFHEVDAILADGDPAVFDMDAAYAAAAAAEHVFAHSVPTTVAGAIAKLRACMSPIGSAQRGDQLTEIGADYLAAQIEATIKGLSRPRLVWAAQTPASE